MTTSYIPDAIRRVVRERANERCEYCLLPESAVLSSHQCDHVIARKHRGSDEASNLALCCTVCNKHKGTDLTSIDPKTGSITPLFNPRDHSWDVHFRLTFDGNIAPLTPHGRVTVFLLQLNREDRVVERQLFIEAGDIIPTAL